MDPELMMEGIIEEIQDALESMGRTDSAKEKLAYSEIVRNLTQSMGLFLNMASDFMDYEEEI